MTPEEMWHMVISERNRYPITSHVWIVLDDLSKKIKAKVKTTTS